MARHKGRVLRRRCTGHGNLPVTRRPARPNPAGNAVLGGFILRGDMYTKSEEWKVVEDLKKNNAKN